MDVAGIVTRARGLHWLLTFLVSGTACSGESNPEPSSADPVCTPGPGIACPPTPCSPGSANACYCDNGTPSTQRCSDDGVAYLPCECGPGAGGALAAGGAATAGGAAGDGALTGMGGALPGAGGQTGLASGGDGAVAAGGSPPGAGGAPSGLMPATGVETLAGSATIGLDWDPVDGATGYRVYWSETPGVTPAGASGSAEAQPGWIHEGLSNGTTYYYVVVALDGSGQADPSTEVSATPSGEFVLEQFGTGIVPDFGSDAPFDIPIADRVHVVIAAEGYQDVDQDRFEQDVDDWRAEVFAINPYDSLRDALVIWKLPRVSVDHIPGTNTAFRVPTVSGGAGVGNHFG